MKPLYTVRLIVLAALFTGLSLNSFAQVRPTCQATGTIVGSIPVCPGDSITLTNPTADPSGWWVSSNPAVASVDSATGVVTGVVAGMDTITYMLAAPCGGPSALATTVVTVNPLPGAITGVNTVCPGGSTTTLADGGSGTWASSNASIATVDGSGIVTGLTPGVDTISYTLVTGCSPATMTVTVYAVPTTDSVTGGGNYCYGGTGVHIGLNSSVTGMSYQLYEGGSALGIVRAGTGSALDFGLETVAGTYTVIGTNVSTTCTVNMLASASVGITPLAYPSVHISSSRGDTLCAGTVNTFSASYSAGGSTPAFQWMVNGANVGTGAASYTDTPTNGNVVVVRLTSSASCATPAAVYDTVIMSVLTNDTPQVHVIATPGDTVCVGTVVTMHAAALYGGNAPRYSWVKNTIVVGTTPTYSFTPANGDNVFCVMNSNYRCRLGTMPSYSNIMTMDVVTPVVPTLTLTARPGTYIGIGRADTIVATTTNTGASATYQWYLNTVAVPAATTNMFTRSSYNNGDSVSCIVTRHDACALSSVNSIVIYVSNVGVAQIGSLTGDVTLTPNPNNGNFTVKGSLSSNNDQEVTMEVTNMLGQTIYANKVMAAGGKLNEQIATNNTLAPGMYFLSLHSTGGNSTIRFVVAQ